jgi:hypothetical protein
MKTYKQYLKLTELQLNLSLPITDDTEKKIIDIAKNDCIRYIKEFGKHDVIMTLNLDKTGLRLDNSQAFHVITNGDIKGYKTSALVTDGDRDVKRFLKPTVDEIIKEKYGVDVDDVYKFNVVRLSKLKLFTKDLWVILPYNTFSWIQVSPMYNSYPTLLKVYLSAHAVEHGIDPTQPFDATLSSLQRLEGFYDKFEEYLYSILTNQLTYNLDIFGNTSQSKYLAVNYSFYSSHWLHSKIMRPGAISKLVY